ncbi:hypothetical protein C9374_011895 [Naegleria lovaniensis]|uniref:cyclin-dependent kinase n=1 Tax=Naegleria lovaniensis TaxID=51637 RepID=A0AA88GGF3_NAELO|nr:uncharacterized protein C9374_011895 [Naegleria lovaniensis]KAG2373606.1 hypothetical protein C9374_011895 [Naegleria lovaniensis]
MPQLNTSSRSSSSASGVFRSVEWDKYKEVVEIGSGAYGRVYSARCRSSNKLVAIKTIRLANDEDGIPIAVVRELTHLRSLKHQNIVALQEVFMTDDDSTICMVMEYVPHDLSGIVNCLQSVLDEAFIKSVMKQLLSALAFIHESGSVHCDLKTSNVFLHSNGQVRLGDFNLSRRIHPEELGLVQHFSRNIVTLWYRPPELLVDRHGTSRYGAEVDMWSLGCIFAELLLRAPLFPGVDEIEQLGMIFQILGTPNQRNWPDACKHSTYREHFSNKVIPNTLRLKFKEFADYNPHIVDLLEKLLKLDPRERISAKQALNHPWFTQSPQPHESTVTLPSHVTPLNENWVKQQIEMRKAESERENPKKRKEHPKPSTSTCYQHEFDNVCLPSNKKKIKQF